MHIIVGVLGLCAQNAKRYYQNLSAPIKPTLLVHVCVCPGDDTHHYKNWAGHRTLCRIGGYTGGYTGGYGLLITPARGGGHWAYISCGARERAA